MLTGEIRNELLVDELQLGERLNKDVQSQNRADFALMLAMLSQDVRDNPVFFTRTQKVKEENLRAKFMLPPAQKEYATADDFDRAQALTEAFHQDGLRQVFLASCLSNEPLIPYQRDLAPEVFAQLTPLKQEKLRKKNEGQTLAYEAIKEVGDGFGILDEINQSKAQTSLHATA